MNKALLLSAAVALALSGSAFGKSTHHRSSTSTSSASTQQFTEADCNMLTVESAHNACMRSIHADSGHSGHMATGGTSTSAEGTASGSGTSMMGKAKAKTKHMWNRAKDNMHRGETGAAAMQHQQGAAEQNQ